MFTMWTIFTTFARIAPVFFGTFAFPANLDRIFTVGAGLGVLNLFAGFTAFTIGDSNGKSLLALDHDCRAHCVTAINILPLLALAFGCHFDARTVCSA
jgi:hypothetical protein